MLSWNTYGRQLIPFLLRYHPLICFLHVDLYQCVHECSGKSERFIRRTKESSSFRLDLALTGTSGASRAVFIPLSAFKYDINYFSESDCAVFKSLSNNYKCVLRDRIQKMIKSVLPFMNDSMCLKWRLYISLCERVQYLFRLGFLQCPAQCHTSLCWIMTAVMYNFSWPALYSPQLLINRLTPHSWKAMC